MNPTPTPEPTIVCRKCGKTPHQIQGFLKRVNEKGVPGIWECRPSCDANLTQDEALIAAVESTPDPSDAQAKTETPRTDAATLFPRDRGNKDTLDPRGVHVSADFARQLESELSAVTAERDTLREELENYRPIAEQRGATIAVSERDKAIVERDAALADAVVMREALKRLCDEVSAIFWTTDDGDTKRAADADSLRDDVDQDFGDAFGQAIVALATNPGASILAELAQLRELRKIDEHLGLEVCSLRDRNTKLLALVETLEKDAAELIKGDWDCSEAGIGRSILARITELKGQTK